MGIHDREYLRDESPRGFQLRAPSSMVMTLIIVNAGFWLADMIFFSTRGPYQHILMGAMACSAESLMYPWLWWQLLTAGFAHDPNDIWHIAFNMFMLWMFGRTVEPRLGKWEFLRFYLLAIVVGSLVFSGRQLMIVMLGADPASCLGASGAVTAVTILFALQNPQATIYFMMLFPMKAWVFAVILVGVNVLGTFGDSNVAFDVHLAGAAFAFAYWQFGWNIGRMIPSSLGEGLSGLRSRLRGKPKLRVHAPDADEPQRYAAQDAEADRILVKIDREGIESLTPRERKILDEYSRRMRQKHR